MAYADSQKGGEVRLGLEEGVCVGGGGVGGMHQVTVDGPRGHAHPQCMHAAHVGHQM
jgi:hypothetical protein